MKRIKDFIDYDNGIFSSMQEIEPDKFNSLFDDIEANTLDFDFYNMASERYASPIFNIYKTDKKPIIETILNRYYKNWLKIKETLTADYEALNPYYKKTTREIENNQNNNNNSENVTETDIYAFNSEDESNKDKVLTNNNASGTMKAVETYTETVSGNNGNTLQAEMIEKELQVRQISFIQIVLSDTKEILTLSIY